MMWAFQHQAMPAFLSRIILLYKLASSFMWFQQSCRKPYSIATEYLRAIFRRSTFDADHQGLLVENDCPKRRDSKALAQSAIRTAGQD